MSHKVLTETEMKVLERNLGFVPTPNLINETDFRRDFEDFSRKIRCRGMNHHIILVMYQRLDLRLSGNHLQVIHVWSYF